MNRYLLSFLITLSLYTSLILLIVNFKTEDSKKSVKPEKRVVQFQVISRKPKEVIAEIQPQQKPIIEPLPEIVEPPKPKPQPKKEIEKKRVVKKEIKKIEKKIVKKEIPKPKEIVEKPKEKVVKREIEPKAIPTEEVEPKTEPTQIVALESKEVIEEKSIVVEELSTVEIEDIKREFLFSLRETINSHKFYPRNARRRGVEGDVKAIFTILQNGEVVDIEIEYGHRLFQKAVVSAIKDSFPIDIPKELNEFPLKVDLILEFKLS